MQQMNEAVPVFERSSPLSKFFNAVENEPDTFK